MASPWYMYRMDDPSGTYGKIRDPLGNYLKPDVNICVPGGVPITALWSGTVTNSGGAPWGQTVTVKNDVPINPIATHTAYNWMGSTAVSRGQHVNVGDTVGYARGGSGVCTAFAFTHDDVYGDGTFSQYNGTPELNPYPYLLALRAGQPLPSGTGGTTSGAPMNDGTIPGMLSALQTSIGGILKESAVFIIAMVIIILGVMLLMGKQIIHTGETVAKGAMLA